jgi:restriction endonuclease S subunit
MSNYTISGALNPERVFILQKSELEKRLDPQFYKQEYKDNLEKIKRINHKRIGEVVKFSSETWNQKDFFENTFPYIEISEIDTLSGEIQNIVQVDKDNAASRAKMIVRENDIIISTTRPNRGAISLIKKEQDFSIASTGFSVIRSITNPDIDREYLFAILRQKIILKQFEQRSSGGNYPAITQEELSNVTIPIPIKDKQKKIVKVFKNCYDIKQQNEVQAAKLLSSIDEYLMSKLDIKLPNALENTLKSRIFIKTFKEISGSRFDPNYFGLEFSVLDKLFEKYSSLKLGDLSIQISDAPHERPEFSEREEVRVIMIENLKPEGIQDTNEKYITEKYHQKLKSTILQKNDLLMARIGVTTGVTSKVNDVFVGKNISGNITLIRLDHSKINVDFVLEYLNSYLGRLYSKRILSNSARDFLTVGKIKSIRIPLIEKKHQKEIAEYIIDIRQQTQQLKDRTKELLNKASEEIEEILLN